MLAASDSGSSNDSSSDTHWFKESVLDAITISLLIPLWLIAFGTVCEYEALCEYDNLHTIIFLPTELFGISPGTKRYTNVKWSL